MRARDPQREKAAADKRERKRAVLLAHPFGPVVPTNSPGRSFVRALGQQIKRLERKGQL